VSIGMDSAIVLCMTRTLGDFVREKREALGLTQTELSARAKIQRTTVNRIETGTTQLPSADIRRRLATALGVSHLDILVEAQEITRDEIEPLGVRGTVEPDPVRADLITRLSRLPLTGDRPAAIRGLIDVYDDIDRRTAEARQSVDTEGNGRDVSGIGSL